jgi:hypothetical protein
MKHTHLIEKKIPILSPNKRDVIETKPKAH